MTKPYFCAQAMNMDRGLHPAAWVDHLPPQPFIRKLTGVHLYPEMPYIFVKFKYTDDDHGKFGCNLPDGKVTLGLCRL